ncbi:MAG TPA: sigma-70 family RNA polymerase sigma factor [Chloroflexia bacterium]|nr:sigma-70 family RNA polymerase sigma factor [Chloroflexia bacterium]
MWEASPGVSDGTDSREEARRLDAAREGDLSAFNWLVLRYQTRVYNLCLRMLTDPDAAADATQEAFLSAYKAIGRFKGEQFRTWLFRIATNACLDMLRSRKRKPTQSLYSYSHDPEDEAEPLPIADLDPTIDPESSALRAEVAEAIQRGLDTLPDDQRIALVLVDVQGLSYDEAAAITGANLGTIKSRINRGRARLRDYLYESGIMG